MVELVSWVGVAVIMCFALVGFVGVVATGVVSALRAVRRTSRPEPVEVLDSVAPAA